MAGVKGRSGRRSTTDEQKRLATIDKAWSVIDEYLADETVPIKQRAEVASKLVVKNIPQEINGQLGAAITKMGEVTKTVKDEDGKTKTETVEFKIGDPVKRGDAEASEHTEEATSDNPQV